ncbi:uncharacterized protein [Montipora capricornis]|uniref:uncharacterized protein isoform X1 n=1 Tax=Montipora capricornis TaxID=246305 RepID=UPI0035F16965
MAAATTSSPLASSVEKTNGAKLSRLLIDGGTTVLRNVFDRYHHSENLAAGLHANYPTLNMLLKKKVLRTAQWDQLFPPGGVIPDSKTFDITLLFVLLTNMCGLCPPPLGWHIIPPPSDTSLEANLARVKYFRNELYGHVSSTGVDTPTFNALWQDISAVLVALGLDQKEIDGLKAEHCGEEYYLEVLLDWAYSEEDIKSQLKDIRQYHATTQQKIEEVCKIQLDGHEILKDNKSKLDKMHQTQINTQEIVEKVCQTLLEDREALQDRKSKLDEVLQTQTYIQETADNVRQTQLEDHETLQESKSKVDEVLQVQTKTQSQLQELYQTQAKTRQIVEDVVKTQEENFETLQAVKQAVDNLKEGRDTDGVEEQVLHNLARSEFKGDIEYHVGRYQEGTRVWMFNKVENWLHNRNSQNRVLVISANAGMGKSVISAVLCKRMQEAGRLAGSHFCQHNNARYRNPQLMLQSLAYHLCHALPDYKQALVKQLSRNLGKDLNSMGVEELFSLLFKEPLGTVADPGRNMLMVIDALDESDFQGRNELLDVIGNHFCRLPCWIRFLCTTRPERNIEEALKHLKPFLLESNDDKNMEDIKWFLEERVQHVVKAEKKSDIVEKLVEKSEGLMLYAYFLVLFVEENVPVLEQGDLDGSLPLAISSIYKSYFKRLENELKELGVQEVNFLKLLSIVTACREPLPVGFLSKLLVPDASSGPGKRKVLKAISSVSSLLPIRDGCLHVIHKSVKDWLMDTCSYGEHEFIMDEKEGHHTLASLCADELDHLKQKGVHNVEFSSTEKYALRHGVRHMLQLDENMSSCNVEKCVQTFAIDLELLYAKLCLNYSIAAEDILWLLKQDNFQLLSENSKGLLNTLISLFRKYYSTFTSCPSVFFQTLLNEGGSILSSMASNMLQNKYCDLPYMEFMHKQIQQGAVQARFQCLSLVACFDVSPQSDYLVCECENGTIQLWSLLTGKLVWERPVIINKTFHFTTFRKVPSSCVLSYYRSVVFHPTMEIILPGILSSAYGMDGSLAPLFPESKCSFTVCSVSGDKTSILTDCPDDPRCIILWSVMNGTEICRTTRRADVLSFAWSQDASLLAISHSTGLICLVDVGTGFRTLAEMTTSEVCGMIKFAPDYRFIYCKHSPVPELLCCKDYFLFCLNVNNENDHTFSLDVFYDRVSYVPWKLESHSKCGFLLGDAIFCVFDGFTQKEEGVAFLLTEQSVLISYGSNKKVIEMLNVNELTKCTKAARAPTSLADITSVNKVVFSLNGESVYVVSGAAVETVSVLDISSGKLKAEKSSRAITDLVPVREGVLFTTTNHTLELWNSQLSVCVHTWPNLPKGVYVTPLSGDLVAYVDYTYRHNQVTFLDVNDWEIVSKMCCSVDERFVACNRKCQVITISNFHLLRLLDGQAILWCKDFPHHGSYSSRGLFSPAEQYFILFCKAKKGAHVLDAVSGRTLQFLCEDEEVKDCKFLSDKECVICSEESTRHYFLRLFNFKSGDQLSVIDLESNVICLNTNPHKQLIAVGLEQSKDNFKLIQLNLPGSKESRKSKRRTNNAPEIPARTGLRRIANALEFRQSGDNSRMVDTAIEREHRK